MAIISTTQTTIARFAAGLYGTKLGGATLNEVLQDVQLSTTNGVNGLKTVLNSYYAPFADQTSAQVAQTVVTNAGIVAGNFGLTAANVADAVAIVTAELNFAAPGKTQGAAIASILTQWSTTSVNDAVYGAAARAWNLKIDQAKAYSAENAENAPFGAINTDFVLTFGNDRLTGTDGNDTFISGEGTLSSADTINGSGGLDTLKASVNGIVAPTISNVETLEFQAQFRAGDAVGDNNLNDEQIVKVDFNTNVSKVSGFNTIINSNSRSDLIIEDVRIADTQKTEDITIVMRETDPGNVDYGVYFDQNSLRNVSSSTSNINIFLMDTAAAGATATAATPLLNHNFNSYTFYANGNKVVLGGAGTAAGKAIDDAETYDALKAAFQLALKTASVNGAPDDLSGTVTVNLSGPVNMTTEALKSAESAKVANSFLNLTGQILTLTTNDKTGISSSAPAPSTEVGGWAASGTAPSTGAIVQTFNAGQSSASGLVTANIILDDVGRGSTGGDLVVGGLSVGETSTSKGVQKFLIEVQDNSKLQTINSTNNSLQEVVIKNGTTTRVDNAFNENEKNAGSLTVRGIEAPNDNQGNNPLPGAVAQHNAFGFSDVRVIDGSAMSGKLNFDAEVTQASIAKYLNLKDVQASPAGDNIAFQYSGGGNNDTISVVIDSTVAASRTLTGREDFTFTANGGAGNDTITVDIGGQQTGAWYADQKSLKNITLNGGSGNDTLNTIGSGDFRVDAGADNDTVYINNDSTVGAEWLVAAANTNLDDLQLSAQPGVRGQFIYNGNLTVVFSGAQVAAAGGVTAANAAAGTNGFEVTVKIPTAANFVVTQFHINQAIKEAINSANSVLSKLLVAEDGPGNTLVIKSLVAGAFNAADLDILVTEGAAFATLAPNEQSTILSAYKTVSANSGATIADAQAAQTANVTAKNAVEGLATSVLAANGANSTDVTDNIVNLGAGNDVYVLSTSAFSNDVLTYTGYGQGVDTIVNFSTTGSSIDFLDFTSYLDGKRTTSGSVESQRAIEVTLNAAGDNVLEANSIKAFQLTGTTLTQTFTGLNETNLLAAINSTNTGASNYAGITSATLDASTIYTTVAGGNNLVGGIGKAVVLIENTANLGQYKAFELTFNGIATANTTADFTGAKLIAEMDFGSSLTGAALANFAGSLGFNPNPPAVVIPVGPSLNTVTVAPAAVNEGGVPAIFTLNTSNVADGTVINYTLGGTGITAADVVGGLLTGTATVTGNVATVNVALANDTTTEGAETLTLTATLGTQTVAANVTVNDTSLTPVGPAATALPVGAGGVSTVAATAAADNFTFNVAAALGQAPDTQINLTGFAPAADRLTIDLPLLNAAITNLAQLAGQQGVTVSDNPFLTPGGLTINFGSDFNGDPVVINLTGVTLADAATVAVTII